MRHLELAGYFDRADFKTPDATWTLRLQFVEASGDGKGYRFTADFVAVPPERTVTNVTVHVPDADAYPRADVLAALREGLLSGAVHSDATLAYPQP